MDRSTALRLLPVAYAEALVLADQGLSRDDLAAKLGLDVTAIGPLLAVAQAKLTALERRAAPAEIGDARTTTRDRGRSIRALATLPSLPEHSSARDTPLTATRRR